MAIATRTSANGPLTRRARVALWTAAIAVTGLLLRSGTRAPALPEGVRCERDLVYRASTAGSRELDLYRPLGAAPATGWPVVVAIHGGGWRGGDKGPYGRSLAGLVRAGVAVASVEYTLSRPGQPSWPENRDDVREAVRWLRRHATELDLDPRRIAALGASAGGHLAALLGAEPSDPASAVAAVVAFYAPSDLTALDGPAAAPGGPVALLLGNTPEQAPDRARAASPACHITARSAPMLLYHGQMDRLVPADQSRRLALALEAAGVRHRLELVADEAHGFGLTVGQRGLVSEILAFLDDSWNDKAQSP
jgi:acetyl esterase/lipase